MLIWFAITETILICVVAAFAVILLKEIKKHEDL